MNNKKLLSVAEIHALLRGKRYSSEFFVEHAGVSPATYYNLVHGKVNSISTKTQEKISDFFHSDFEKMQEILGA